METPEGGLAEIKDLKYLSESDLKREVEAWSYSRGEAAREVAFMNSPEERLKLAQVHLGMLNLFVAIEAEDLAAKFSYHGDVINFCALPVHTLNTIDRLLTETGRYNSNPEQT